MNIIMNMTTKSGESATHTNDIPIYTTSPHVLQNNLIKAGEKYMIWEDRISHIYPALYINIVLITQIFILDSLVIRFYWAQRQKLVPMLYILICFFDMTMCLGHITQLADIKIFQKTTPTIDQLTAIQPVNTSLMNQMYKALIDVKYFYKFLLVGSTVMSLANYMSIFLSMLLAVCRTIKTVQPFYYIKKVHVIAAAVMYLCLWVGVLIHDFNDPDHHDYKNFFTLLNYPIIGQSIAPPRLSVEWVVMFSVPFVCPSVIVIVCFVTTCIGLRSPIAQSDRNRHVTVTILMITALFIVCHTSFTVFNILEYMLGIINYMDTLLLYQKGPYICGTMLPLFNAAVSPVIIVSRSAGMKRGMLKMVDVNQFTKSKLTLEPENVTQRSLVQGGWDRNTIVMDRIAITEDNVVSDNENIVVFDDENIVANCIKTDDVAYCSDPDNVVLVNRSIAEMEV